jgi:hypothetical protein
MGSPFGENRLEQEWSLLGALCGEWDSSAAERPDPEALLHRRVGDAVHLGLLAGAFAGVLAVGLGIALHSIPIIVLAGVVELVYLLAWERASG